MKPIKILSFAVLFLAVALASTAFIKQPKIMKTDSKGFAVVELFTSEGCSSCPPADALVARIEKETADKPVYILAYHVDYWDRLGWKDQFSSAAFSNRQSEYARYLHLNSVYTPQIVVNGKTEFVGSEEGTLRNAIRTNLEKDGTAQLTLTATAMGNKQAAIKYNIDGADKNTVLQVAVLEKNAASKVERGENKGRTLAHVQIVRKLQQVDLTGNSGVAGVALPQGFDQKSWEVIGFLQNKANGSIIGAAKATFSNESVAAKSSK